MKFTIVLFTLILVTVAAAATTTTTAAANRIQNKAYAYYYCNSYCTQAVNDENSCGYYDTDVSNQEYYACLCTKSSYYNNLRSCDCFTKVVYYYSTSICSRANVGTYVGGRTLTTWGVSATKYRSSTLTSSLTRKVHLLEPVLQLQLLCLLKKVHQLKVPHPLNKAPQLDKVHRLNKVPQLRSPLLHPLKKVHLIKIFHLLIVLQLLAQTLPQVILTHQLKVVVETVETMEAMGMGK